MQYFLLTTLILLFTNVLKENATTKNISENKSSEFKKEFYLNLGKPSPESKFEDDKWSIWGASLVKGEDGLYHMFYSRWEKELGWAWVTDSEIAHAISKSPFGPFEFKDVALPARGKDFWDGLCTHNPNVHKFNGKYYLYYMGNTGDGKVVSSPGNLVINPIHRNNQRIGVAVADDPNGPWQRFDSPLIDVSADNNAIDALMVSNPSVTQRPDGGYLMVYKAVGKKKAGIWGGPVVHCVATSEKPTGPFIKFDKPIFQAKEYDFPAEDPFIWYQDGLYRAIVKDMHGAFTNAGRALVLFESEDGIDWKLSNQPLVYGLEINWNNGQKQKVIHLERPQLYIENGLPVALLCASDILDKDGILQSFNVQIPVLDP